MTSSTSGMANTYNENSDPQLAIIQLMVPYIREGIEQFDSSLSPIVITDFGSSHGRNSIIAMKIILKHLEQNGKLHGSPLIVHNDLPTNDWTKLFQLLAEENSYQGVAKGCSFYQRCLPEQSLSIGFTASSMHWLSKIPNPIRNHCFHTFADEDQRDEYTNQAKQDFDAFITHRSKELISGGILVLSIPSFNDDGIESMTNYFDQLYIVAQSFFTREELEHFTVPIYLRSLSECVDQELFDRCSLKLIKAELAHLELPILNLYHAGQITFDQLAKIFTKVFESTMEPLISHILKVHGRSNEEIKDISKDFWIVYEDKLKERPNLVVNGNQYVCASLILKKI